MFSFYKEREGQFIAMGKEDFLKWKEILWEDKLDAFKSTNLQNFTKRRDGKDHLFVTHDHISKIL